MGQRRCTFLLSTVVVLWHSHLRGPPPQCCDPPQSPRPFGPSGELGPRPPELDFEATANFDQRAE
eukprot:5036153-Alexandrium_andersonii.AAC.1